MPKTQSSHSDPAPRPTAHPHALLGPGFAGDRRVRHDPQLGAKSERTWVQSDTCSGRLRTLVPPTRRQQDVGPQAVPPGSPSAARAISLWIPSTCTETCTFHKCRSLSPFARRRWAFGRNVHHGTREGTTEDALLLPSPSQGLASGPLTGASSAARLAPGAAAESRPMPISTQGVFSTSHPSC